MNNLHRELAPISDEAWSQIQDEATREQSKSGRPMFGESFSGH